MPLDALATPGLEAAPAPQPRDRWVRHLPWAGVAIGLVALGFLVGVWIVDPVELPPLLLTIPVLFMAGKEAAIPAGIASDGDVMLVATTMILTDTAATLILYPLVHVILDNLERRRGFLGRLMRSAVRRAERRRRIVDRYGWLGLLLFAIIPFAANGPPFCAALGRLAGLRPRQVVPVLVAAISITTVAWSFVYHFSFRILQNVNRWIPMAFSVAVMLTILTIGVVGTLLERGEETPA